MTQNPIENSHSAQVETCASNRRAFNFILKIGVIAMIVLGVSYVKLTNSLATRGFELEALKNERIALQKDFEKAEIASTVPTSLYALKSSEIVQEMDIVNKQKFLHVMEGQVAVK